jgi:sulfatase maturation enzyme AslB (radical SAM superfamily)
MKYSDAWRAWQRILTGRAPMMSIEITKECPLRCPGCYAYEPNHLASTGSLRSLSDFKGQELVDGVLNLVREHRPLHLSIVGGEPLVRYRELDELLPQLSQMGLEVMVVTSAVRPIPIGWREIKNLQLTVSIDGLQPDHDVRRAPATYSRILPNIAGHLVTVHCTVTHQMTGQPEYFRRFLSFWSDVEAVKRIWFSLFTPQVGEQSVEILSAEERSAVLEELAALRKDFPKLELRNGVIQGYRTPPTSPAECIFARTTLNITSDLKQRITPCQFGGNPDCSQCGCIASAGLKAVGDTKVVGPLYLKTIFGASEAVGRIFSYGRRSDVSENS